MRVLLTGFEPFGGSQINSSWEAASRVWMQSFEAAELVVRKLPVSFRRAGDAVSQILTELRPDVLIMFGQHGRGENIEIERIAVNLMDSVNPDNDGYCPQEQTIQADGESAYFCNLPVKALRDALLQRNIPAKVSNSAGLYVCNSIYYNALYEIDKRNMLTKVVFIHLPKISEEFSIDILTDAVITLIEKIRNNI